MSETECTLKQLPPGEWVGITGEPEIVASFEALHELAKAANAAVLKPSYVPGAPLAEEEAFLRAWDAIYQAQVKKTNAVRYRPEKGLRGSILAAGRKPAPVPKWLMDQTLKEVTEDTKRLRARGKEYPGVKELRAARAPAPKPRGNCKPVSEPTFIDAPDGGSPILLMPGQSRCLDANTRHALKVLNDYKKLRSREAPAGENY